MMNPEEILDIGEIQEPKDLTDLSKIGRAIIANNKKAALIKEFRDKELEKIKACCDQKIEQLGESNDYLTGMASLVMKCHDYSYANKNLRKYEMPGIGAFRFSVTRESVDTSVYDEMSDEQKTERHINDRTLFNTKTVISPNKKQIVESLKLGEAIEGFKLKPKFEKFEFKGE